MNRKLGLLIAVAVFQFACFVDFRSSASRGDRLAMEETAELCRAEAAFYAKHQRFAQLEELRPELANREVNGFRFNIVATVQHYSLTAWPTVPGETGHRSFYVDDTLVLRATWQHNERASATSRVVHKIDVSSFAPSAK